MNFQTQFLPCEIVKAHLSVSELGFIDITSEYQKQRAEQAEYKIYYVKLTILSYISCGSQSM